MRDLLIGCGVLLGIILVLPARGGETIAVGGALVTIADGWKKSVNTDDTVVLTPADLPGGVACTFTLLGGEPFDGSLKDRLASEWKGFEDLGPLSNDDGGKVDGEGNALEVASHSAVIELKANPAVTIRVWLLIARTNGRIERMVFSTSTPEAFGKYGPAVSAMFNGIKYAAPKPAGPLAGVCFGLVKVESLLEPECWIFLPDGVVYKGFPYGGPAHMDLDLQRKERPSEFGEYRIDGEEVIVTMKSDETPTTHFARSKGEWAAKVTRIYRDRTFNRNGFKTHEFFVKTPTELRLAPIQPCDGMKLAGTYQFYVPFWGEKNKPIPTIRFAVDGDFVEDGAIRLCDSGAPGAPGGGQKPSVVPETGGRGKYSIGKNTLDLTYADGTTIGLTFLTTNAELSKGAPATLYVQEKLFNLLP
ncbi:MAG: hypothetical protein JWN40_1319 [Phycisphaerales bacterium]|nr:hypothetical protein [Phycisphaerales bacterium]